MSIGPRGVKPALLMVSHGVPCEDASTTDRRAWRLVEWFARTHEVHLACLADGPVSLAQWRRLHAKVKQIVIEPGSLIRRYAGRMMRRVAPRMARSIMAGGAFDRPVREWSARISFDAVLHTHLELLPATLAIADAQRMADLDSIADAKAVLAAGCEHVIVSSAAQADAAEALGLTATIVPSRDIASKLHLAGEEPTDAIPLPAPLQKAA